jgi:hypothetical protein
MEVLIGIFCMICYKKYIYEKQMSSFNMAGFTEIMKNSRVGKCL